MFMAPLCLKWQTMQKKQRDVHKRKQRCAHVHKREDLVLLEFDGINKNVMSI